MTSIISHHVVIMVQYTSTANYPQKTDLATLYLPCVLPISVHGGTKTCKTKGVLWSKYRMTKLIFQGSVSVK